MTFFNKLHMSIKKCVCVCYQPYNGQLLRITILGLGVPGSPSTKYFDLYTFFKCRRSETLLETAF